MHGIDFLLDIGTVGNQLSSNAPSCPKFLQGLSPLDYRDSCMHLVESNDLVSVEYITLLFSQSKMAAVLVISRM